MEGISRIDSEHSHSYGWFVRVYYKHPEVHSKFFSDGKYGGKRKALEEAKRYLAEYMRENPPPEKLPYQREPIATNTTGVNGISETYQRDGKGEKIPCFQVFYAPKKNERKNKRFYHHHYDSREEAFEEAVKFRKEQEAEILRLHRAGKR